MAKCLISGGTVEEIISFGKMPIANGFLREQDFNDEFFFELKVGFCPESKMIQLTELVEKEKMFHENYAFYSSTSAFMTKHFKEFAGFVTDKFLKDKSNPFVVEIGSNDGIMLKNFADQKIEHLGIEPSKNVAEVAIKKGINTISEFFDEGVAKRIISEHGQADAFLGANVMCHIPYIHSVLKGIKLLLKPKGVLIFEEPYLGNIIEKTSYDQIYDEHAFYFSIISIRYLMNMHDLEIIDAIPQSVHGGSMRYCISHKGAYKPTNKLEEYISKEFFLGLDKMETFIQFKKNVEHSKSELISLLNKIKKEGKRVVGYGATSKSTTVINYCNLSSDLIEFIVDTTPIKQNKFTPGKHIPVLPFDKFYSNYPDYTLLFAWNHLEEIMAKEINYTQSGGKWILYVPSIHVL
jgi:methylation protein EvaC